MNRYSKRKDSCCTGRKSCRMLGEEGAAFGRRSLYAFSATQKQGGMCMHRFFGRMTWKGKAVMRGVGLGLLLTLTMLGVCACGSSGNSSENLPAEGSWQSGRYLRGRGDANLIIFEGDPCAINVGNDTVSFENIASGDLIRIYMDVIRETWPGQTTAYAVEKLEDGEIGDIDPECLEQLREFNWIE